MNRISPPSLAAWLLFVCGSLVTACSGSDAERSRFQQLTARCSINSDCDDPLVCAFGRCHEECSSSRDCPGRANCVRSDDGDLRVCQLEVEISCNRDGDCSGDQTCAADGECRDGCKKVSECAEEQVCVEQGAVCADEREVDKSGALILVRGGTTFVAVSGDSGGSNGGSSSGDTNGSTGDAGASSGAGNGTSGNEQRGDLTTDDPCKENSECASGVCEGVCISPTCSDGVRNGNERAVDCGGSCLAGCGTGTSCEDGSDCVSGRCTNKVCTPVTCPSEPGVAEMVALPAGFCIDSTEVTRKQYATWLANSPSLEGQVELCAEVNLTYAPPPSCLGSGNVCKGDCDDHPQVCVDWCDAAAYCKGVGKRLCSNKDGAPAGSTDLLDGEMYYACVAGSGNLFPYGSEGDVAKCNSSGNPFEGTTWPVGDPDTCQSANPAFAGVFDLVGNVAEWEDNCSEAGDCRFSSTQYRDGNGVGNCSMASVWNLMSVGDMLGFRCCATP